MYDPQNYNSKYTVSQSGTGVSFVSVMKNVYLWMTLALAITGLTAMAVATQPEIVYTIFTNKLLFWGLIAAELGIVWFVSSRVMSLSVTTSGILFAIYALLNGVFFSSIFLVFEIGSIAQTFFIIFYMALIGLIIATVVNWFFKNDTLMSICNYAGVVIFTALTAYDTQKIKNMLVQVGDADSETGLRISLLGSLTLYLDFINLFLYLLRIFGRRR